MFLPVPDYRARRSHCFEEEERCGWCWDTLLTKTKVEPPESLCLCWSNRVINHWIKLSTICMVDSLVQFDPESPRSNLICLTRFHPARHSGHYCTALTQQQQELEGRVAIHSLWTVSVRVMLNRVINHKALDQAIYNTYMVESLIQCFMTLFSSTIHCSNLDLFV